MAKIKKDDLVQVIAGRDKGMQGRVLSVDTRRNRVVVEGVQRVKKHVRAGQSSTASGGIETVEAPIHISNVALVHDGKPIRVGYREEEVERDGRKKIVRVRIGRRGGKEIEL
ncbi:50S ribosomal protein L24 [Actinotignum urinale]|uniref:Large ribosomal subunit protein uL24 n=1 Tax=Actinotignum urinale TaxID=190146 RepID=A0AAW9HXY4_9ACTO|nr:50S ribosomal protein L24 [Actinotignum urinale]MDY5129065.1 50S ribosomal protein L24 [Actinotignum urinale]MDY5132752.1 50S ribosomal protein L24 [Actinotignum urinale]MDY5150949.1 50S ribosomal protein L24 [Actinotignum urinale]MDY5154864.1 50S ribosomal protein L24 [Actinotignum urinale]MDY5159840.1 50S ribosomal protein L24 [Actinotignum urinale]